MTDRPTPAGALPHPLHQLHQLHSAGPGSAGVAVPPALQLALEASFGSLPRWQAAFSAMAQTRATGAGWVVLVVRPHDASLVHQWAGDAQPAVADGVPILALCRRCSADQLDWAAVDGRYQRAVQAASAPFGAGVDETAGALLIDVRRAAAFGAAGTVIAGARWRDPAAVSRWAADLPRHRPLVLYCVHGHAISQAATLRLRAAGLDARYLRGGIDGWQAAGRPLVAKPGGPAP